MRPVSSNEPKANSPEAGEAGSRPEFPVIEALRPLLGAIGARQMREMNWRVNEEGRLPADVASEFLSSPDFER